MRIDLHTHSAASDGTQSPAELVAAAAAAGLDVVALTDHDTTAGWEDARRALPPGLALVRGAELSCASIAPDGRRTPVHLLAYLFDPDEPTFAAARAGLRHDRVGRARRIVDRLVAGGIQVQWCRVEELAAGATVGRPHIARALVETGVIGSVDEAFADLLCRRGPYYVPKADVEVTEAVRMVLAAGGVPVFAHPFARRRGAVVGEDVIAALAGAGLAGIEVDHPDHDVADRARLATLTRDLGLVATGSSDFHGANKTVSLGRHLTDPASYDALIARATGPVGPVTG